MNLILLKIKNKVKICQFYLIQIQNKRNNKKFINLKEIIKLILRIKKIIKVNIKIYKTILVEKKKKKILLKLKEPL
jgi:hypothetical protein